MTISEYTAIEAKLLEAIDATEVTGGSARVVLSNLSAHGKYAFTCALLAIDDATKAHNTLVQAAILLRDTLAKEKS